MDVTELSALVGEVERRDAVTVAHTWRVALYTQALAEALGVGQPVVRRMMRGAIVHDIGKLDLPEAILRKPGPLTEPEFDVVRTHTVLGWERLRRMGEADPILLAMVRSHHERLDGSGYPDGLEGAAIPRAALVFAVVDSFDAMTSVRAYRSATGTEAIERAARELEANVDHWYCDDCVRAFLDLLQRGQLDWIMRYYNDRRSLDEIAAGPSGEAVRAAMGTSIGPVRGPSPPAH